MGYLRPWTQIAVCLKWEPTEMKQRVICAGLLSMLIVPLVNAQPGPAPLPPTPTMSDINSITRQRDVFDRTGIGVARVFVRFDGQAAVSMFEKKNPQFVSWNAASDNQEWKKRARTMKPVTTPAKSGRLVVKSRWNSSNFKRLATCDFDQFGPGFYEIQFLNSSDSSDSADMSRDNYICHVQLMPLTQEVLDRWVDGLDGEAHKHLRSCTEANGSIAGPQLWECVTQAGVDLPPLDKSTLELLM